MPKAVTLSCLLLCAGLAAQAPAPARRGYEVKSEISVAGTVARVKVKELPKLQAKLVLVLVKGPAGRQILLLGPESYLASVGLSVAPGDTISAVGALTPRGKRSVVLVRTLSKGGRSWNLRDANGSPQWRGGADAGLDSGLDD